MNYTFAEITAALRFKLNLSQLEFAQRYGVSRASIANYETGKQIPSAPVLMAMIEDISPSAVDEVMTKIGEFRDLVKTEKAKKINKLKTQLKRLEGK